MTGLIMIGLIMIGLNTAGGKRNIQVIPCAESERELRNARPHTKIRAETSNRKKNENFSNPYCMLLTQRMEFTRRKNKNKKLSKKVSQEQQKVELNTH